MSFDQVCIGWTTSAQRGFNLQVHRRKTQPFGYAKDLIFEIHDPGPRMLFQQPFRQTQYGQLPTIQMPVHQEPDLPKLLQLALLPS